MDMLKAFHEIFGPADGVIEVRSPGRVNLIGEHTDYQGGLVLPIAVDRFIRIAGRLRSDNVLRIHSLDFNQQVETTVDGGSFDKKHHWVNYPLGVVAEFGKRGKHPSGMDIVVSGDIPMGGGLSSSAAFEVATAVFILRAHAWEMDPVEVVKLARRAENLFVGVNCGIMDQFASYLCRKDHALFLDCKRLDYSLVPLRLGGYSLLLIDTKKERKLAASAYNERVAEVTAALEAVRRTRPEIEFLGDLKPEALEPFKNDMDPVCFRRALHIVRENERVRRAVAALKGGDVPGFGTLLVQSHESLRDLYEVSCEELDFIVAFSRRFEGVAGARLTGGGFGGCCIAVVKTDAVGGYRDALIPAYESAFGRPPVFLPVRPVDGGAW